MITYKGFSKKLPAKICIFAFCRFSPPTERQAVTVRMAKDLAHQHTADLVVFTPGKQDDRNLLPIDKKLKYLSLVFPDVKFQETDDIHISIANLGKKYKKCIMVASENDYREATHLAGYFPVISTGLSDKSSILDYAAKGDFESFHKELPIKMRSIDAKQLFGDIRKGMGLEVIKESPNIPYDAFRDKYISGKTYKVGDIVESLSGESLEIIKTGTNYLLVKDKEGNTHNKWLTEVTKR